MQKITPLLLSLTLSLAAVPDLAIAGLQEGKDAYLRKDFGTAFEELLPEARDGNAQAQHLLGRLHLQGAGTAMSTVDARKWFQLSAEQGYTEAMDDMGRLFVQGQGVAQNFKEAEQWFRKAVQMQSGAPSAATPPIFVQSDLKGGESGVWKLCKQVQPQMPRAAIQNGTIGTVFAKLVLLDGKPKDVIIISGPDVFHEAVRQAMLQAQCTLPTGLVVAQHEFVFKQDPPLDHYAVWRSEPYFASQPPAFSANWQGLSNEQRSTVREQHSDLGPQDEPPYPARGMGQLHESLRFAAQQLRTPGRLRMSARVDGSGQVEAVTVHDSPSPALKQNAAAVVYRTTFKGGVCAGQPCTMELPIDVYIAGWHVGMRATNLERLTAVASSGDALSQNALGSSYERGYEAPKDLAQAVLWYRRSAEQGFAMGQYNLARMYEYGIGTQKDLAEAARWHLKAAHQGHALAQSNYGWMLMQGQGVAKDHSEGFKWLQRSAAQGYTWGINNLGVAFANGWGVRKDYVKAFSLYLAAAQQGSALAQRNVASAYAAGLGVAQDERQAAEWARRSAEQGDAYSQFNLGVAYAHGKGVAIDRTEAFKWYQKSAAQGNAAGQNNLADAYENGYGVAQDVVEALKWYNLAAAQKNSTALISLSHMYRDGRGVAKDEAKAVDLLQQSADLGLPAAQMEMGQRYAAGKGLDRNAEAAAQWFRKAARAGHLDAVDKLKEMGLEI